MPVLGIGTYALSDSQAENSVYWALKDGYRLIDTAHIYGNERGVGRGIKRAIDEGLVKREDIFVTTKMWKSDFNNPDDAVDESLSRLGLDYIDLMILHHSQPSNDEIAYKGMERAVQNGKLHSIGLSNYYEGSDFDRLLRWQIQNHFVAIPGSADEKEIAENFDIFDFELTDEDLEKMQKLDTGTRFFTMSEEEQERAFTGFAPDFNNQK